MTLEEQLHTRVGRIFQLFIYVLWDQSLGHFVFGSPLGGSWGGSKQVGEGPEAVILQVLLPIIKIPFFFKFEPKFVKI